MMGVMRCILQIMGRGRHERHATLPTKVRALQGGRGPRPRWAAAKEHDRVTVAPEDSLELEVELS